MTSIAIVEKIMELSGPVRLVAIDGRGGAGKTTFAAALSAVAGNAPVVHTDDFASDDNPISWWPLMLREAIEPLSRGEVGRRAPAGRLPRDGGGDVLEPAPIVIVEGVSAGRLEWAQHLSFLIWIETPTSERQLRVIDRDGEAAWSEWDAYELSEDEHFEVNETKKRADLVIDGRSASD